MKKKFLDDIKDMEVVSNPAETTLVICTDFELSTYDLYTLERKLELASKDTMSKFSIKQMTISTC